MKRWLRRAPALLGLLLLFGAIYVVQKEFRNLKLDSIGAALHAIPPRALGFSALWTVLSYGVLTFYDRLGTIYAGHKVSYGRVSFASFCAYALSHNLGFAAVSGAAVRYRLYAQWGLTPVQIAKTVAFCSLTFGLGGMVLGGAILLAEPHSVPFFGQNAPVWSLWIVGLLLWGIVAAYVTLARVVGKIQLFGHIVELPGFRMAMLQVLLATVDVAVTASIFYALLPHAPGLTWPIFLGVYVGSYTAGLAANLPGGIGVFDTAMLLGLDPYLDPSTIVGAIIVFRLFYYVIPLFLAGGMFAGNEIVTRGLTLRRTDAGTALGRWSEPDFAIAAATTTTALSGVMLLCLGILTPQPDFAWIDPDLSGIAVQAGQFVPSLIGAGLLVLAAGLAQRVTLAWGASLLLLAGGFAFILGQGVGTGDPYAPRPWMAGVLLLTIVLIAPFRRSFYRHARLMSEALRPANALSLFVLVVAVLALAVFRQNLRLMPHNAWWRVILSPDEPNSLRATIALTVALALFALWRLVRPAKVAAVAPTDPRAVRLGLDLTQAQGVVLGEAGEAGIAFRRAGRMLLGLGDPAGSQADRISAIWRLRDLAQQEGRRPALWRVGATHLSVYRDIGLTALPLDPQGTEPRYLVCPPVDDISEMMALLPAAP